MEWHLILPPPDYWSPCRISHVVPCMYCNAKELLHMEGSPCRCHCGRCGGRNCSNCVGIGSLHLWQEIVSPSASPGFITSSSVIEPALESHLNDIRVSWQLMWHSKAQYVPQLWAYFLHQ
jgi:hypothetical protein